MTLLNIFFYPTCFKPDLNLQTVQYYHIEQILLKPSIVHAVTAVFIIVGILGTHKLCLLHVNQTKQAFIRQGLTYLYPCYR